VVSHQSITLENTILSDDTVWVGNIMNPVYPKEARRVRYFHPDKGELVFITNNFTLKASEIALVYKDRWQIELFFKWIKQHLKIKRFWGHSENAVKLQICVALVTYLTVAILKEKLYLRQNLYEILQILSVSLFDKSDLNELFSKKTYKGKIVYPENTAQLFDF